MQSWIQKLAKSAAAIVYPRSTSTKVYTPSGEANPALSDALKAAPGTNQQPYRYGRSHTPRKVK